MRKGTLITGLELTEVVINGTEVRYPVWDLPPIFTTDDKLLTPLSECCVQEVVVPITQFCKPGKPDVYIAYSKEVEELLGMPFSMILREKASALQARELAVRKVSKLEAMTAWEHIKAAWRIAKSRLRADAVAELF